MNSFRKQLGIQLLIAFAAVIAMVVLTQLVSSDLVGNAMKIQQQKTDLAFRIRATDQLASLKADSDKAQPLFAVLNGVLPPKDSLIDFGQQLIQLGKGDQVNLGFTFGGETAAKGDAPGFIRFSLTGASTYENFQKFLKDVEKSKYYVKFNSIDLVRQADSNDVSILIDGQVYYQ